MKRHVLIWSMVLLFGFVSALGLCVQALYAPQAVAAIDDMHKVIAVDAGHGGIDGGVRGITSKKKESEINLEIAKALQAQLEESGFEVVLTRSTDNGLYDFTTKGFKKRDMQKRKEILQRAEPALVISLHQNFYPTKSTRGAQVFYSVKKEEDKDFALILQEKLNRLYGAEGVKERNCMKGDFFILDCCAVPSVLIECGFLSSEKDEKLLLDKGWQKRIAQSITSGVLAYFSQSSC